MKVARKKVLLTFVIGLTAIHQVFRKVNMYSCSLGIKTKKIVIAIIILLVSFPGLSLADCIWKTELVDFKNEKTSSWFLKDSPLTIGVEGFFVCAQLPVKSESIGPVTALSSLLVCRYEVDKRQFGTRIVITPISQSFVTGGLLIYPPFVDSNASHSISVTVNCIK